MRLSRFCSVAAFLACAPVAFGQLDSNSITVTASRTIATQPDQIVFSIVVNSDSNTSLDDVLGAVQGSGITAANLLSIYSVNSSLLLTALTPQGVSWAFSLPVPLSQLQATTASLTALQQTIGQRNKSLGLTFTVQNAQVSPTSQHPDQCPTATLVADAQTQAQKLAAAAGLTAGPVIALSDQSAQSDVGSFAFLTLGIIGVPTLVSRLGDFTSTTTFANTTSLLPLTCVVTVKFQLLRYQ